jgi:adenosylcobinamide kinase / adenosylcobinamide-phosphate guanylyltransferase
MLTLLIGGARSGKSALAVEMGRRFEGAVVFVATAEPFDADMTERIERHRTERPDWPTIEAPRDLAAAVGAVGHDEMLIVDCLTVWVANLFMHVPAVADRTAAYQDLADALQKRSVPTIVITNEVGLGIHPDTELGREYRDELGRLNQQVAAIADRALLLVAGKALELSNPWDALA